ncbi:hypothetical protein [Lentilactobacillus rapi]|nr:hypothetical protein [Lentilactobacillus rapi]
MQNGNDITDKLISQDNVQPDVMEKLTSIQAFIHEQFNVDIKKKKN